MVWLYREDDTDILALKSSVNLCDSTIVSSSDAAEADFLFAGLILLSLRETFQSVDSSTIKNALILELLRETLFCMCSKRLLQSSFSYIVL